MPEADVGAPGLRPEVDAPAQAPVPVQTPQPPPIPAQPGVDQPEPTLARPVAAAAGDTFHADYGPLGNIAFRFV